MTNETKKLNLAWQKPEGIFGLVSGEDALMLYNSLPEPARKGIRYDEATQTMIGSNPLAVVCLDNVVKEYGARTTNLRDLSRPEVMAIAKGEYHINPRTLVARSSTDYYERNNPLLKTIYELVEEELGTIIYPFMIEGFNFVPNEEDTESYGLKLVPTEEFKVVQDERLGGEYNGKSFSEVDELGIPKFDIDGSRKWFTREEGLSILYLGWSLDLNSYNENLVRSGDDGRVVLVKSS